nr:MAG TPA: helix-turn-helix domain protein [Caudoviricetes sp.]
MEVRHSIFTFRVRNHLTQTQLGKALGINQSYISKIERGDEEFPAHKASTLVRLMAAYGYPIESVSKELFSNRPLPEVQSMTAQQRRIIGIVASGMLTDTQLTEIENKCIEYIGGYRNAV